MKQERQRAAALHDASRNPDTFAYSTCHSKINRHHFVVEDGGDGEAQQWPRAVHFRRHIRSEQPNLARFRPVTQTDSEVLWADGYEFADRSLPHHWVG